MIVINLLLQDTLAKFQMLLKSLRICVFKILFFRH